MDKFTEEEEALLGRIWNDLAEEEGPPEYRYQVVPMDQAGRSAHMAARSAPGDRACMVRIVKDNGEETYGSIDEEHLRRIQNGEVEGFVATASSIDHYFAVSREELLPIVEAVGEGVDFLCPIGTQAAYRKQEKKSMADQEQKPVDLEFAIHWANIVIRDWPGLQDRCREFVASLGEDVFPDPEEVVLRIYEAQSEQLGGEQGYRLALAALPELRSLTREKKL